MTTTIMKKMKWYFIPFKPCLGLDPRFNNYFLKISDLEEPYH